MKETKRSILLVLLFVVTCGWMTGCSLGMSDEALWSQQLPEVESSDIKKLTDGNSQFAFELYHQLRKGKETQNIFFSPYSISTALAMAQLGARGNTAKEMADVLHFSLPTEQLHTSLEWLQKDLNNRGFKGTHEISVANRLWGQKGYPFLQEFLDAQSKHYNAPLEELDFGNTEEARKTINTWVEQKTKDRIKELLKPGSISPDTRLVLTNAIYFKGLWEKPFDSKDTSKKTFTLADGSQHEVDMMRKTDDVLYTEQEGWKLVSLAFKNKDISMVLMLPKDTTALKDMGTTLNVEKLNKWIGSMTERSVPIYLPKFKLTTDSISLSESLQALGMKDAFLNADFSGITDKEQLGISDVLHKAFIEVNEEGSEAAAATAVVVKNGYDPNAPVFNANRPFILMIRDNTTGNIMFMGQIMKP